jgi:hypothetical protein
LTDAGSWHGQVTIGVWDVLERWVAMDQVPVFVVDGHDIDLYRSVEDVADAIEGYGADAMEYFGADGTVYL